MENEPLSSIDWITGEFETRNLEIFDAFTLISSVIKSLTREELDTTLQSIQARRAMYNYVHDVTVHERIDRGIR